MHSVEAVAPLPDPAVRERIEQCWTLIETGRCLEARALLSSLAADAPRLPAVRELLAISLLGLGDFEGAEREMLAAVRLDRRDPGLLTRLGEILFAKGASSEAEQALRGALALNRLYAPAAVALTRVLLASGRPAEALQVTTRLALRQDVPAAVLEAQAAALRALGNNEDAQVADERAACAAPRAPIMQDHFLTESWSV